MALCSAPAAYATLVMVPGVGCPVSGHGESRPG